MNDDGLGPAISPTTNVLSYDSVQKLKARHAKISAVQNVSKGARG